MLKKRFSSSTPSSPSTATPTTAGATWPRTSPAPATRSSWRACAKRPTASHQPSAPNPPAKNSADKPDAWFEARPATARALFDGNLDPLHAMIDGSLSMGGDPRQLLEHREILDGLGDIFARVRAATIAAGS